MTKRLTQEQKVIRAEIDLLVAQRVLATRKTKRVNKTGKVRKVTVYGLGPNAPVA